MPASDQSAQTNKPDGSRLYSVVTGSGRIFVSPDDTSRDVRKGYTTSVLDSPSENASGWNASKLPETSKAGNPVENSTPYIPLTRQPLGQGTEKSRKTAKSTSKQ